MRLLTPPQSVLPFFLPTLCPCRFADVLFTSNLFPVLAMSGPCTLRESIFGSWPLPLVAGVTERVPPRVSIHSTCISRSPFPHQWLSHFPSQTNMHVMMTGIFPSDAFFFSSTLRENSISEHPPACFLFPPPPFTRVFFGFRFCS